MAKLAGLTLTSAEADFPDQATVTFTYRPPLLIDPVGSVVVHEIDALTGWCPASRTVAENWTTCPASTSMTPDGVRRMWSAGPRNSYVAWTRASRGVWSPSTVVRSARQRRRAACTPERDPDGGMGARDDPSPARNVIAVPAGTPTEALNERHRKKSEAAANVSARIVPAGARW